MAKIILENKAKIKINREYLEEFRSCTNLPTGSVLLVLHDSALPERNQGVCVASQLINFAPDYAKICNYKNSAIWDCCVAIDNKWCMSRDEFPAYFTYLLGHEFAHAYLCLSDIALHVFCCLIERWISPTSGEVIRFCHELPNEQLFDQFGKYVSLNMHGTKRLEYEINILKEVAGDIEKERLEMIQVLTPKNRIEGLRKIMLDFSKPYKDELIQYWKEDYEDNGANSLTSLISDYDKLFEY